ncbi:MAG TPA: phosphate acyltransferase, partial [Bacteroidota bacterium]|nr:phosphate acyltransferase [Bacteroidota bacterium]
MAKAKSLKRTIVLPDATDERAIQAARILADKGIVQPVLIGKSGAVQEQAKKAGTALGGIRIIDPETSDKLSDFS